MALAIKDGVLYNNDDAWEDYYILDDDENLTWSLKLDSDDNVILEEVDKPEQNRIIVDDNTKEIYLIAITADAQMYLKSKKEMGGDCMDWVRNTNHKVSRILRKMDIGR